MYVYKKMVVRNIFFLKGRRLEAVKSERIMYIWTLHQVTCKDIPGYSARSWHYGVIHASKWSNNAHNMLNTLPHAFHSVCKIVCRNTT